MFDIRRFSYYPLQSNENNLIMELAGNSSQLNSWYHLEIYYTEEFLHDMSGFCIYIPSNQHPTHYWKLVITLFQECPENLIDYTESTSHIIQLTEPIINTEFLWYEYDIPSSVWITITGLIITHI